MSASLREAIRSAVRTLRAIHLEVSAATRREPDDHARQCMVSAELADFVEDVSRKAPARVRQAVEQARDRRLRLIGILPPLTDGGKRGEARTDDPESKQLRGA